MNEMDKIEEHSKQLHKCLKDRTCGIVDRGLAQCLISGKYCSYLRCPKLEDNVTQPDNNQREVESLK
jgi:hypothetical protein